MFDLRDNQKGGERLDTMALNANIFKLLTEANVKPIYIDGAYRAFTETTKSIVTQPESFKIGFLFLNVVDVWNRHIGTYPDTPNVDSVTLKDTTGTSITATLTSTSTGQFVVEKDAGFVSWIGSWRYCEFTLGDDYVYMVLERFGYDSGDAENGVFDFAYKDNVPCDVYMVPVRDLTETYLPFFYNQQGACDFAKVVDDYIYERFTGISTSYKWENLEVDQSNNIIIKDFVFDAFWQSLTNEKRIFSGSGESFDVWFFTEGKVVDSSFLAQYRHYELFSYGSDTLVHLVLEDNEYDQKNLLISGVEWIEGLSIFWKTTGKTYYPDLTSEPQNYVVYTPVIRTGIDKKPVDMFQTNFVKYLVGCRYNENWANLQLVFNPFDINRISLTPRKRYNIKGVANTEISGYPYISRGTFLIS